MATVGFIFIGWIAVYIGRKVGWTLSRFLYQTSIPVVIVVGVIWGLLVAAYVQAMIGWLHPYWIFKIIFGYILGAYIAYINYGLVNESTIPEHAQDKHNIMSAVPMWTYIIASILAAWLIKWPA